VKGGGLLICTWRPHRTLMGTQDGYHVAFDPSMVTEVLRERLCKDASVPHAIGRHAPRQLSAMRVIGERPRPGPAEAPRRGPADSEPTQK